MTRPRSLHVAIKREYETDSAKKPVDLEITGEATVLSQLNHPNVTRLLYYFESADERTSSCHWLVLQFMPTNLSSLLRQSRVGSSEQSQIDSLDARMYSFQLWAAVGYVGDQGFLHLDIKPANILIDESSGLLQLADFGNARRIKPGWKLSSYQVSRFYRAPELLFGASQFGVEVDWWATACGCGEIVLGKPLLCADSTAAQTRLIIRTFGFPSTAELGDMKARRPRLARRLSNKVEIKELFEGKKAPDDLLELLKRCLVYSPSARPRPEEVLKDAYFFPLFVGDLPPRRANGQLLPACIKKPS